MDKRSDQIGVRFTDFMAMRGKPQLNEKGEDFFKALFDEATRVMFETLGPRGQVINPEAMRDALDRHLGANVFLLTDMLKKKVHKYVDEGINEHVTLDIFKPSRDAGKAAAEELLAAHSS